MGKVSIPKVEPADEIRIADIKTLYKNQPVDLVKGWMTNYSDNKISFLTTDGAETVIDTNDVWDISLIEQEDTIAFDGNGLAGQYYFAHPYPFANCEEDAEGEQNPKVSPHHLLGNPLLIKTELDRLQAGHEELKAYVRERVFYPKPQVYTNRTTLGVWASINLRHGSSAARNSSFIPVLRNELSEGLYKYQRVIVTGSAPMPFTMHEEPQTQFYYNMKSSYFHLTLMYDLTQLISSDYRWQLDDLDTYDDRQNEKYHLGVGFDYGNYAIEYSIAEFNYAIRHDALFHSESFQLNRLGFIYSHRLLNAAFYYGFANGESKGEDEEELVPPDGASQELIDYINYLNAQMALRPKVGLRYRYYRLNLDFPSIEKYRPGYSLIYRTIDFEKGPNKDGVKNFIYEGESLTNALYLHYDFPKQDLLLTGFVSMEITKSSSNSAMLTSTTNNTYLKGGISIGLLF